MVPKQQVSVMGRVFHILLDRYKRDMAVWEEEENREGVIHGDGYE